ncbi:dual oxidase-like isoform X2 [Harpegnathos saltator]|uniref:dual oxidase-like isoform X2 n=1 Tax=Harpegnathos saltator TaxID=610380 RepID=UPI000DBED41A|nr:dual oxidase-like isoform X2 [Harpegnathos saltator]
MTQRRCPIWGIAPQRCTIIWMAFCWIMLPSEIGAGHNYMNIKQRYDGFYNNLAHPDWGSVDSRLIRKVPAAYSDSVYAMAGQNRPSPRKLSDLFMQGDEGLPSVKNRTALFAFFGNNL